MMRLLLLLMFACSAFGGDVTLPSGRLLKQAVIGPFHSTKEGFPKTVILKYVTTLDDLTDASLKAEVDDVWTFFRPIADEGENEAAVIMIVVDQDSVVPFVSREGLKNFVFKKEQGEWALSKKAGKEEGSNKPVETTPVSAPH